MADKLSIRSFEYKNDYLYIVIRQTPEVGAKTYIYCCGINTTRFDPICWGKAGICSNPAFKGLQQMRADASRFALENNFQTLPAEGFDCSRITPKGDGWYRDHMQITGASEKNIKALLNFSVMDLVKTVLFVCAPDTIMPTAMPTPPEMQKWLNSMNVNNYRAAAPPPIAKRRM